MRHKNEILVGIFILTAIVVVFLGIRYLQGIPLFDRGYALVVVFPNAQGLRAGSDVLVRGVRVGRVNAVRLEAEAQQVAIEITIDSDVRIPGEAEAQTLGFEALLDVQLQIVPGPAETPPLQPGDTIFAFPPPDILDEFQARGPAFLDQVDTLMAVATSTLESAQEVLTGIRGDFAGTLSSLDEAASGTAALTRQMQEIIETQGDTVAVTIGNVNRVLERTDDTLEQLTGTAAQLEGILLAINEGDGSLGRLLNEPDLHDELEAILENLNEVLSDFQENPGRFLREMTLFRVF